MRGTTALGFLVAFALAAAASALPEAGDVEADYDATHWRGAPRGGGGMFPKIVDPPLATAADADEALADGDWVIGVSIGGEDQAFPVAIMGWPEIVNIRCGGAPIAVTW